MEKWKHIKGYENKYLVSNKGRVKSIDHKVNSSHGATRIVKGRILKSSDKPKYKVIQLSKNSKVKMFTIHSLVAEAFLPEINIENKTVDHIDGDKHNNHVSNLQYLSNRDNCLKYQRGCK